VNHLTGILRRPVVGKRLGISAERGKALVKASGVPRVGLITRRYGRDSLRCFGQYARGTQATRFDSVRLFAQALYLYLDRLLRQRAHPFFDLAPAYHCSV